MGKIVNISNGGCVFLIVEGLHDTGKSTLVNDVLLYGYRISERQKFQLYSGKRLFPEFSDATVANVSDFALGTNCAVVWFAKNYSTLCNVAFDRLHLSEYAYSIAKRGANIKFAKRGANIKSAFNKFKMIDSQLAYYNVKLIYLYCDYDAMMSRAKSKNAVYDKEDFEQLTQLFIEAYDETKIQKIRIDTGSFNKNQTFTKAVEFIGGIL